MDSGLLALVFAAKTTVRGQNHVYNTGARYMLCAHAETNKSRFMAFWKPVCQRSFGQKPTRRNLPLRASNAFDLDTGVEGVASAIDPDRAWFAERQTSTRG
jgi:hypothetical protein